MHDLPLDEVSLDDYRNVPLGSGWALAAVLGWHVLLAAAFYLGMLLGSSG